MTEVLISIVMPTYNRADFIVLAVESVLAQTYKNWQLIIVDDGSIDGTKKLIEPYLLDERIEYYCQNNQGQSVARNKGLAAASGEWVSFLDSDNLWPEKKLEICIAIAKENPKADIVYGDVVNIDIEGQEIGRSSMPRYSGGITTQLLRDNFITMNTTMTRRECFDVVGGFDEQDRIAEDYDLWLRMSTQFQFLYIKEYLAFYRVMDNQLSSDKDARFSANFKILKNFKKAYPNAVSPWLWRRGFSTFFNRKAHYEASLKNYKSASLDLLRAMLQNPFWLGPWRVLAKLMLGKY